MNEMNEPHLADPAETGPSIDRQAAAPTRAIVVVLGMHRSGTSLCSNVLSALGIDMADIVNAHPFNAKGEWERFEIRELHDQVLELFDRGYYSAQHDLPLPTHWPADPRVKPITQAIEAFLQARMLPGVPFGFKDPRTARLLPIWHRVFASLRLHPRFVLCLRNPAQVARSLCDRDGLDPVIGEYRWFAYMAEALAYLRDYETCVIEYEDWFPNVDLNLQKLTRFLDIRNGTSVEPGKEGVSQIIDARLRHDRTTSVGAQPLVAALYQLARQFADSDAARDKAVELIDQFAAHRALQLPLYRACDKAFREELARAEHTAAAADEIAEAAQSAIDDLRDLLARTEQRAATTERERDIVAEERDRLAKGRDLVAEERDRLAKDRDLVAEERDRLAKERDRLAKNRDLVAEERDRLMEDRKRLVEERDGLAREIIRISTECGRWFEAVVFPVWRSSARQRPRLWWRAGRFVVQLTPWRGKGSPMELADRARDERQWAHAARLYIDSLAQFPERPQVWVQLGHALKEAGRVIEAEFAYRRATEIDDTHIDALVHLGGSLRGQQKKSEALAVYSKALGLSPAGEIRDTITAELQALKKI